MIAEGIWSKRNLIEEIRCFNGGVMTELKRNESDSLDPMKRIPIYVGGFRYDEDNETFVREGKGCLIDERTGIAIRECEWINGVEENGVDLIEGWYNPNLKIALSTTIVSRPDSAPLQISVSGSMKLNNVSLQVTDLTISSNCCNDLNELDLNQFEWLRSIEIGDDCFGSVQTFKIEGLHRLKTIKIGKNSFTQKKNSYGNDKSKSFHILNCESLESIQIRQYSFSDHAGEFELKNLPQLQSIQIGTIESDSYNFDYSSFVIRGIEMILNIVMIRSSKSTIHYIRW